MILKLKCTGNNDHWFYFEAHEVSVMDTEWNPSPNALRRELGGVQYFELLQNPVTSCGVVTDADGVEYWKAKVVAFYDQDGYPREITFNTDGFLMNDKGQTIERLN